MLKEISFSHRGKKIRVKAKKVGFIGKGLGLMFKSREKADALLFTFEKPTRIKIHSLFVFFPFFAVWLDRKNKVIESRRIESLTFHASPRKSFMKLVEVPINQKYKKLVKNLSLVGD